jgi:hypothetical protein
MAHLLTLLDPAIEVAVVCATPGIVERISILVPAPAGISSHSAAVIEEAEREAA